MSDVHDFGTVDWNNVSHATCCACGVQRRVRGGVVEYRPSPLYSEASWRSERIPCVRARAPGSTSEG